MGKTAIREKGDVRAVAACLSDVFPALEEIEYDFDNEDMLESEEDPEERARMEVEVEYGKRWDEVLELIPVFKAVRKQEREWKRKEKSAVRSVVDVAQHS